MENSLNILWASTGGNAENVANRLNDKAKQLGIEINQQELNEVSIKKFSEMKNVAVVTSTFGEGDFPANGEEFWQDIENKDLDLKEMNYSVCALGDSSHDIFCGAGKKLDEKLIKSGANKILERQECDGSDEGSEEWSENFLKKINGMLT